MKNVLLMIILSGLVGLAANPIVPVTNLVSEVWFDSSGHLFIEFAYVYTRNPADLNARMYHGADCIEFPDSTILNHSYPNSLVLDISALNPEFEYNPLEDSICFVMWSHGELHTESLKWGNSFECNVSSFSEGQSIAKAYLEDWPHFWWVKDEPPTPGYAVYSPVARAVVTVQVKDQNYNPVPGVYVSIAGEYSVTDVNGVCTDSVYACKGGVTARIPDTWEYTPFQRYFFEPNETYFIPIQMELENPLPMPVLDKLNIYPTPYVTKNNEAMQFSYNSETTLTSDATIRIYDIKGRFIKAIPMPQYGRASWVPDEDFSSGMYIAKLISGKKFLHTTTLSIIK